MCNNFSFIYFLTFEKYFVKFRGQIALELAASSLRGSIWNRIEKSWSKSKQRALFLQRLQSCLMYRSIESPLRHSGERVKKKSAGSDKEKAELLSRLCDPDEASSFVCRTREREHSAFGICVKEIRWSQSRPSVFLGYDSALLLFLEKKSFVAFSLIRAMNWLLACYSKALKRSFFLRLYSMTC